MHHCLNPLEESRISKCIIYLSPMVYNAWVWSSDLFKLSDHRLENGLNTPDYLCESLSCVPGWEALVETSEPESCRPRLVVCTKDLLLWGEAFDFWEVVFYDQYPIATICTMKLRRQSSLLLGQKALVGKEQRMWSLVALKFILLALQSEWEKSYGVFVD